MKIATYIVIKGEYVAWTERLLMDFAMLRYCSLVGRNTLVDALVVPDVEPQHSRRDVGYIFNDTIIGTLGIAVVDYRIPK